MQVVLEVLVEPVLVSAQEMDVVVDAVSRSLLGPTLPVDLSHPSAVQQTQALVKGMLNPVHEVHWGLLPSWLARGDLGHQRRKTDSFPSEAACSKPAWS